MCVCYFQVTCAVCSDGIQGIWLVHQRPSEVSRCPRSHWCLWPHLGATSPTGEPGLVHVTCVFVNVLFTHYVLFLFLPESFFFHVCVHSSKTLIRFITISLFFFNVFIHWFKILLIVNMLFVRLPWRSTTSSRQPKRGSPLMPPQTAWTSLSPRRTSVSCCSRDPSTLCEWLLLVQ